MDTLTYITNTYHIDLTQKMPVEIPNVDRRDLAHIFRELGFKKIAEVGTERGIYAKMICNRVPEAKLYCIDPWLAYKGYREHVTQDKLDGFYEVTRERMAPYEAELIRKTSIEAAKDFEDKSLDAVYIDANHEFQHVVNDIAAWLPKIRTGGIISGHDYIHRKNMAIHVVEAVEGYTSAYDINPWFVLGSKDIKEGERRDRSRSWFWVVS